MAKRLWRVRGDIRNAYKILLGKYERSLLGCARLGGMIILILVLQKWSKCGMD